MEADGTLNDHNRLDLFQLIYLAPPNETILMSPAYSNMPRARYPGTAPEMTRQQCLVFERAAGQRANHRSRQAQGSKP